MRDDIRTYNLYSLLLRYSSSVEEKDVLQSSSENDDYG